MAKSDHTRARARKQPVKSSRALHNDEWARVVARAKKTQAANKRRETVAQWRALKKLGYIKTTVTPAQKRLTKYRAAKIKKAFNEANKQAVLVHGKVVRALQREVTEKGRIKYDLDKHFKLIRSKYKPSEQSGIRKTLKGFVVELLNPSEKVRITKRGKVKRYDPRQGKFTVESEFLSAKDILKLADKITAGKFKLKKNQVLMVKNFGGFESGAHPYYPDALDLFVADMTKYQTNMRAATYGAWLNMTEVRVVTIG